MTDRPPPEVINRLPHLAGDRADEPVPSAPETNGEAPSSLIAGLREQRRRNAQRTVSDPFELPFWDGHLAARYHHLDDRAYDRLVSNVQKADTGAAFLRANADLIIGACHELVARRDEDDDWGPIFDDGPVRYEKRLADALGLELKVDSARAVVEALFYGRKLAINAHAADVMNWLTGKASEVAALEGESTGSS